MSRFSSPAPWRQILRQNFNSIEHIMSFLELTPMQRSLIATSSKFPLQIPLRLAQKMEKSSLDDPLVRQFLPLIQENSAHLNFVETPVEDHHFQCTEKLLHKYNGRVLIVCTSACAMHCRYCFRQNFDYQMTKSFSQEIEWIAKDSTIHEVILSGGDPLSLSNLVLSDLLTQISQISHLKRIRFHSRFLIGIPERIDCEFVALLQSIPQQVYFVIHCNHFQELDEDVFQAFVRLQKVGCVLLNQAVLLKGVNDSVEALAKLCLELSNRGILPYYLHQLDRVQGAAHFEVEEDEGHRLIREISKSLPGYAVPKYVREIPGQPSKTLL